MNLNFYTHFKKTFFLILFLSVSQISFSQTTLRIGPGHDYSTLTAAIAHLTTNGISQNTILSLESNYVSTTETYPITIGVIPGASASNRLIIQPAADGLVITRGAVGPSNEVFRLDGATYVSVLGNVNGQGNQISLSIENANSAGSVFRFINGASHNVISYCNIEGVSNASQIGLITFRTSTAAAGNNFNIISHNNLRDFDAVAPGSTTGIAGFPKCMIYSSGTVGKPNSNNQITDNKIFNYHHTTISPIAINLMRDNSEWTISRNRFYQESERNFPQSLLTYAIDIGYSTGSKYLIDSNIIGYSGANGSGVYSLTGSPRFIAIAFDIENDSLSTVSNNIITAISLSSDVGVNSFSGIQNRGGSTQITGNTIGATTGTGSINIATGGSNINYGIRVSGARNTAMKISHNNIGSINLLNPSTDVGVNFMGISNDNSTAEVEVEISNNLIGSRITPQSISITRAIEANISQVQGLQGIVSYASRHSIKNNVIQHLNNSGISNSYTRGIYSTNNTISVLQITGNKISNLTTDSRSTSTGISSSLSGIAVTGSGSHYIANDTIVDLKNLSTNSALKVNGIVYYSNGANGLVNSNLIYNISTLSTNPAASVAGILSNSASVRHTNNMIRLGYYDNNGVAGEIPYALVTGIDKVGGNFSAYYNTIVLAGTPTGTTASHSYVIKRGITGTDTVMNNILYNVRANADGVNDSKHYFFHYIDAANLTQNHNHFYGTSGKFVFGSVAGTDVADITTWRNSYLKDFHSNAPNRDPKIVSPLTLVPDLKLGNLTSAAQAGRPITGITTGFNGVSRNGRFPNIGADAALRSHQLSIPPMIIYNQLTGGSTPSMVLSNFASITNRGGISETSKPRIYFKRSTDADVFGGNTSADNGWKYAESTNTGFAGNASYAPHSFNIDFSILFGGSPTLGTTIEYFVVAMVHNADGLSVVHMSEPALAPRTDFLNITGKPHTVNSFVIDNQGPLPLKLISFNGEMKNNVVNLNWVTASEENIQKFVVERSTGKDWKAIGELSANNTNAINNYSIKDLSPEKVDVQYYRLSISENNGVKEYSNVIAIYSNETDAKVSVYPNPSTGIINLTITGNKDKTTSVQVLNSMGQEVLSMATENTQTLLDLSDYDKGTYFVRIITSSGVTTEKVAIQ